VLQTGSLALGICGSPRPDGNTATAIEDFLAGAAAVGHETKAVQLGPDQVRPIADCAACARENSCTIADGFDALMEQVTSAELLVLGTPLYWYGPSAQLKAFVDRWSCLLDLDEHRFRAVMRGKRAVLVVAQGERGFYEVGPCLQMMDWTLRYLEMVMAGRVVIVGHARGDYRGDAPQRQLVRAAGEAAALGRTADVLPPWFHLSHRPGEPLGGTYPASG
jgi:multimeric flavodoxin WrbA